MAILPRHAVVVIHGIGEQRPLDTLLSFVRGRKRRGSYADGIVTDQHAVYGGPDLLRGRADQRRLKVTWNHAGTPKLPLPELPSQANTDFYEYYWAAHFRDTTWRHVFSWLRPLVFRRRKKLTTARLSEPHSTGLRWEAALLWAGGLGLLLCAVFDVPSRGKFIAVGFTMTGLALVISSWLGLITFIRYLLGTAISTVAFFVGRLLVEGTLTSALGNGTLSIGVTIASLALSGFLLRGLGDAARYLNNTPDNVDHTEKIRADIVTLLENLHDAKDAGDRPTYERVVVVGHSLGGVIAYDAVRLLWARYNRGFHISFNQRYDSGRIVAAVERAAATEDKTELRKAQYELYLHLRDRRRDDPGTTPRWLISDLVTLGTPLAHADLLMAGSADELDDKKVERLLPSAPPQFQRTRPHRGTFCYRVPRTADTPAHRILHHAAVFAATRWTNLYFPHDLVGGELAPHFGFGVHDIRLPGPGHLVWFGLRFPHTSYWRRPPWWTARNRAGTEKVRDELAALIRRPSTLTIRCLRRPLDAAIARLRDVLLANPAVDSESRDGSGIPIRLLVSPTGILPVGRRLGYAFALCPGATLTDHARVTGPGTLAEEIREVLGPKTKVYLARSPDIRPAG
jgi:hypothetical protein